jgi:hypothetical protein
MAMREFIDFIMFNQDYGNYIGWFAYYHIFKKILKYLYFRHIFTSSLIVLRLKGLNNYDAS